MNSLAANPVTQAYVASAAVLGLNMLALANNTALSRAKAKEVVNPEDTRLNPTANVVFEAGNEKTARYRRAHRNALENNLLFLITGYLLTLTAIPFAAAAAIFGVFSAARVTHSITYVLGVQPWRTASFGLGLIVQFGVLVYLGYAGLAA